MFPSGYGRLDGLSVGGIPWSDCNDEQRLDVHDGLLLSALWDAAFDQGLVSSPTPLFGPKLSETARKTLGADAVSPLRAFAPFTLLRPMC